MNIQTATLDTSQEVVLNVSGFDSSANPTSNFPKPVYNLLDQFWTNGADAGVVDIVPQADGSAIVRAKAAGVQNIGVAVYNGANVLFLTVTVSLVQNPAVTFALTISGPRPKTS